MLYDKSAVKNRIKSNHDQSKFTKRIIRDWFRMDREFPATFSFAFDSCLPLNKLKVLTSSVSIFLMYDLIHEYQGLRTINQVLIDKKGHCIEQGILLYSLAKKFDIPIELVIAKNPSKANIDINDVSYHLYLGYSQKKELYLADPVHCEVCSYKEIFADKWARFSLNEFSAFLLQMNAEDLGLEHKKYGQALSSIEDALIIDPNNYGIYATLGDIYFNMEKYDDAEKAYLKMIEIAPDIADTHKVYGDFCFDVWQNKKYAIDAYTKAASLPTDDKQVIRTLEKRLRKLKQFSIADEIKEKYDMDPTPITR